MTGRGVAMIAALVVGASASGWLWARVSPGAAITLIGVVLLLALVARYDNHTGSCMMVTVLALLVLALLSMLLTLLLVAGSR